MPFPRPPSPSPSPCLASPPPLPRGHIAGLDKQWGRYKGSLAKTWPFELDVFQKGAIIHMENVSGGMADRLADGLAMVCVPLCLLCPLMSPCPSPCPSPRPRPPLLLPGAGPLRVCGRPHLCRQDGCRRVCLCPGRQALHAGCVHQPHQDHQQPKVPGLQLTVRGGRVGGWAGCGWARGRVLERGLQERAAEVGLERMLRAVAAP